MPVPGDLVGPPILILAGLVVMAVFAVIAVRYGYTRTKMKPPAAPPSSAVRGVTPAATATTVVDPATKWAVRGPSGQIERAAHHTAVAWASQDLTDETELLRSFDDGSTWEVVPRAEWRKGMTRP